MDLAFAITLIALGYCLGIMTIGGALAMLVRKDDKKKATHRNDTKIARDEPYDQYNDNAGLTILRTV